MPSVIQEPGAKDAPAPNSLSEFESGIIDIFVRLADLLGLPRSVAEIYGLLYASADPLAFQDILDRLHISKGSASQGLRFLRSAGAIKTVYIPGDRRDHFVPETEMRALLAGFLREKVQPHLASGSVRLSSLKELVRNGDSGVPAASAKLLRGRVDKLAAWHKRGKLALPLVTKFFG